MSSGIGSLVKVIFKNFDVIAGPVISLVYPLYASVRAIESRTQGDDKQWLTYWALYSLIKLFELTFYGLIEWIPLYPYVKLALTSWLVLPGLSGAAYLYEHYVRSFLLSPHTVNVWYVPAKKDDGDLGAAAGRFTPPNDSGAPQEKIVSSVDTSAKYVGHSAFDDTYSY
ncbi:PREDICTED: HVA22-like protein b [Camelina sativa]|uniref:HVA22-like protein n=1 Tax=Camelina sativa TaxID=90675 RepID=A0ABM0VNT7_CAMSA|nr:PREDICTED: HVA22-like protein b [Camelina sativa]